jgi:hypothetical protein
MLRMHAYPSLWRRESPLPTAKPLPVRAPFLFLLLLLLVEC